MIKSENLTYTATESGYTIALNGTPWIVQDGYIPYPGETMAEAAQNHINQILADQAAAEAAANQPSETDILGQQVAALTLDGAQKDTLIQQLGAQMVQAQLDIATLKGGVA